MAVSGDQILVVRTLAGSAFGIFWGLWSLPYWLPESIQEFEALIQEAEYFLRGASPESVKGLPFDMLRVRSQKQEQHLQSLKLEQFFYLLQRTSPS